MTEVLFYHLQRQPLERVLPVLLEKSLERGWRVVVQAVSEERADALDALLWTFRDDSFLPHGTWREREAPEQPVLLTVHEHNPNAATIRFLLDGAPVPGDAHTYERIVVLFDGEGPRRGGWRPRALERVQGARLRGDLLANRRARPLAEDGVTPTAPHPAPSAPTSPQWGEVNAIAAPLMNRAHMA